MEFSCIGDSVNLASRVEGLSKKYKNQILITEYTKNEVGNLFWTREIDTVVVTGRTTPVVIYELIGLKPGGTLVGLLDTPNEEPMETLPEEMEKVLQFYANGLDLYKKMEFKSAAKCFGMAVDLNNDGPSATMFERCQEYMINPPEDASMVFYPDSK